MPAAESPMSSQIGWLPRPISASCKLQSAACLAQGRCRGSLNYATSPYLSDFWDIASSLLASQLLRDKTLVVIHRVGKHIQEPVYLGV